MQVSTSYRGQILARNYSYAFHGRPISYFEHRGPVYLKEMRRHYSSIKSFAEKYGDYYTGYAGHIEKELSLFYGKENLKNWLNLMTWWQGGESPAKVAVAVGPTPFVMKYPGSPGGEYGKKVRGLMEGLTTCLDVDGLVLGSRYSLDPRNLLKYSLIIIPEDMGTGLSQETAKGLLEYVQGGGKLLVVSTPLKTGKRDLTDETDLTAEFCGVEVVKPRLPGYLKPSSEKMAFDDKKFWAAGLKQVVIKDAEVLVKEGIAGYPLLLMKGNACFSAMGCSPESAAYFAAVVRYLTSPPVQLSENAGMRILESIRKEGMVCLALWGQGRATLKLDPKALGLGGGDCRVKDIVTGRVIGDFEAGRLIAGVPIEIKYVNQLFILAVGPKEAIEVFKGIYPSEDVFAGMTEGVTVENPEVPVSVPDKAGVKVGVYHGGLGASCIISALNKEPGINCYSLPRLDGDAFAKSQVVIIPQAGSVVFFNQAEKVLRSWVQEGGGVMLLHDAVGFRRHATLFPEVGKAQVNPKLDAVKVVNAHPVTAGFNVGDSFTHAYVDHVILEVGDKRNVLLEDEKGNSVLAAAQVGKGRAVLSGMATGYASKVKGSNDGEDKDPTDGELRILVNSVKWLAKETR